MHHGALELNLRSLRQYTSSGIVITSKESFAIGAKSLPGNPYDSHALKQCLGQVQRAPLLRHMA